MHNSIDEKAGESTPVGDGLNPVSFSKNLPTTPKLAVNAISFFLKKKKKERKNSPQKCLAPRPASCLTELHRHWPETSRRSVLSTCEHRTPPVKTTKRKAENLLKSLNCKVTFASGRAHLFYPLPGIHVLIRRCKMSSDALLHTTETSQHQYAVLIKDI